MPPAGVSWMSRTLGAMRRRCQGECEVGRKFIRGKGIGKQEEEFGEKMRNGIAEEKKEEEKKRKTFFSEGDG